ncbi:proteasome accessory factor PafA2 family protein [Patescibacteria group bacterium AH-259-L07]|nr:proteasome accessory factor PafA2 family protein [Patescibacteria group bacterium AH-259-L07]
MAIEKVCGIETEWSILLPDRPHGDMEAGTKEFNLFLKVLREFFKLPKNQQTFNWEFSTEQARKNFLDRIQLPSSLEGEIYAPNGARIYVDWPHLEYSTPECKSVKDLICADKAGNALIDMAAQKVSQELEEPVVVYKTNSDRRGHSWASHENYLMQRKTFNDLLERVDVRDKIIPFLVTRQIVSGSGKMGIEKGLSLKRSLYQISQRADFITQTVGLFTTPNRNIINTRDEPHADPKKYARLHVILGDANLCDWSLYLRIGTTRIVLKMLEDDFIHTPPVIANPVKEIKNVSRDTAYTHELKLKNGSPMRAHDIQYWYVSLAKQYLETHKGTEEEKDIVDKWYWILAMLDTNPLALVGYLDDISKKYVIDFKKEQSEISDRHTDLKNIDIAYHNINPQESIYYLLDRAGKIQHLVADKEIKTFITSPPQDTRAYLRGKIAQHWPNAVLDWEKIKCIFDVDNPLTAIGYYDIVLENPLMNKSEMDALFNKIQALSQARK